jgi:hypothetical protein
MGHSGVQCRETAHGQSLQSRIQGCTMKMARWIIYGAGTPLTIEAPSPEIAEAYAVESFGVKIENIVTVKEADVVLHRRRDS